MIRIFSRITQILLLLSIGLISSTMAQTLTLEQTSTDKKYAPQGSKVAMIYLRFKSLGGATTLSSLTFKNSAPGVFFGNKITKAYLYSDSANSGVPGFFDDGSETELASITYNTNQTTVDQTFLFTDTIASGDAKGYFVVYQLDPTATLGATTNITILEVNGSSTPLVSKTVVNSVVVTGLEKEITTIMPEVVLPGQTNVPALKLALKMSGEDLNKAISITVKNIASNFVMTDGLKNGITTAYLYKGNANQDTFNPLFPANYTVAQQVNAGSFTSSSSVTFSFPSKKDLNIGTAVTTNLFVVYDIGVNFQVTDNTKIYAQVSSLRGLGDQSQLEVSIPSALPSQPAASYVAGLSVNPGQTKSLVDDGDVFGANSVIPIFTFEIRANQTDIAISTINIQNPGTVPFVTTSSDPKNIQKVSIYADTNFSGNYSDRDTLIASTYLGRGSNQADRVVVTMNPFVIKKYNGDTDGYGYNNAMRFFVTYTVGQYILANGEGTSTSNTGAYAVARLENIAGTVNVSNTIYSVPLSGTKPVIASPEALVKLSDALDVFITSSNLLSPTSAIRGQTLVPMLYLVLDSANSFASTNVVILNESATFSPSNEGISKIWLYRDVNNNFYVDSADTLLGVRTLPSQTTQASISGVPIYTGKNNWIVMYDIGINAPYPTIRPNVSAQLNLLAASSGLVVGGQPLPFPSTAATLSPTASGLTVSDVTFTAQGSSSVVTNFTTSVTVTNIKNSAITVSKLSPRFYLSTIAGTDISYEFTFVPDVPGPYVIAANSSKTITFSGTHSNRISEGNVVIDPFIEYSVPQSIYPYSGSAGVAQLVRYYGSGGWTPAYLNPPRFTVGASTQYSSSFPAYVQKVSVVVNEKTIPFSNYDAIAKQSEMKITLVNSGSTIDESSLIVKLNGVKLTKIQNVSSVGSPRTASDKKSNSNSYSYNAATGVITIQDVGSASGLITLSATDIQGNSLQDTSIYFSISDNVKIENLHAYPSPYLRSSTQPLNLGFSLTQPATVKVYIYNHVGRLVYEKEFTYSDIGYQVISFNQNDSFVSSGIYIVKMYATDNNGNKSNAVRKFAIY